MDCEDYALLAEAAVHQPYSIAIPAFGILWVVHPVLKLAHALNFCVDAHGKPWLYEPQDNTFYADPAVKWRFYMMII